MGMAERAQTVTRHDLEAKIVKRCWEDEAFRKEFTTDPAGAFVKYLRIPAAGLPTITVHQEALGTWHIVLPERPANPNELSEEDLEKVAGGVLTGPLCLLATLSAAATAASVSASASVVITLDKDW
jgi:hypothetical protein